MWSPTTLLYKRANPAIQRIAAIRQCRTLYFYCIKISFGGKSRAFESFHIILTIVGNHVSRLICTLKQEMSQSRDECPQRNWSSIIHI